MSYNTLQHLLSDLSSAGAKYVYAKTLAPNDNSKNQVYLGDGFAALNILPHGKVTDENGPQGGAKRDRQYAPLDFFWMESKDRLHAAPHGKLILYPRYPEVRLSGFLLGCKKAPSDLMDENARIAGRVLFLGVTGEGQIIAYVVAPDSPVVKDVSQFSGDRLGVFSDLTTLIPGVKTPREKLIDELRRISRAGWISSVKLDRKTKKKTPYKARNGGGYTLEAELGIAPNGDAEPDFDGWEVKQYAVDNFKRLKPKNPVTLMTPEPDGGVYKSDINLFMTNYGYPDQNGKPNRRNFGGDYRHGKGRNTLTGLEFGIVGFDVATGKITDDEGMIYLADSSGVIAASWSFKKLLNHWQKKHARAVYVPSQKQDTPLSYKYAPTVTLAIGTDFIKFLKGVARGHIYLDPALKAKMNGGKLERVEKRRSQIRVNHANLEELYDVIEVVSV